MNNELKRFQELAGISEKRQAAFQDTKNVSEFEFDFEGKQYIADLEAEISFDWDREDGVRNYEQNIKVLELGVAQGDEYVSVGDSEEIAKVQDALNNDTKLSRELEKNIDIEDVEPSYDDSYDEPDFSEGALDYTMLPGEESGDTSAMNIGEDEQGSYPLIAFEKAVLEAGKAGYDADYLCRIVKQTIS